jgi:hypothetical protein
MSNAISPDQGDPDGLEQFVQTGPSAPVALVRALAAVVCEDGMLSLPEVSALAELAKRLDESNLSAYTALRCIELRPSLDSSLRHLAAETASLDPAQRSRLLDLALPVIELQGDRALVYAERIADSMRVQLPQAQRAALEVQSAAPWWQAVTTQSVRRVTSSSAIQAARNCYLVTRNPDVARALAAFLDGAIEKDTLAQTVSAARDSFLVTLASLERTMTAADAPPGMKAALLNAARALQTQIEQRLQLIRARIVLEKRQFEFSLEDLINDSGNAFEAEAMSLFREADQTKPGAWKHLARSTFGRELERRISRAEYDYGNRLSLLKQEVSVFAQDYGYAVTQLLATPHHARLAALMPDLRMGTRMLNVVETAAITTLKAGAVAGLVTGAAIHFLGAAVLPVVAPAVPTVAAAMVVAGLIKKLMDGNARLARELAHKRKSLEDELRKQLLLMQQSYFSQLDETQQAFEQTAVAVMRPLLLEAYAQAGLQQVQVRLVADSVRNARALLTQSS